MLDANAKYSGAWGEISARIQARDRVLLAFIALTSTFLGFALTKPGNEGWAVAVGYLSLGTVLLTRHHDLIIGHLSRFQRMVASSVETNDGTPEWTKSDHLGRAMEARTTRDWAQGLFIFLGVVGALYVSCGHLTRVLDVQILPWLGSLASSGVSIYLIFKTRRDRAKLAKN